MPSPDLAIPLGCLDDLDPRGDDLVVEDEVARRLEDWIVTNLDDHTATSEADWQDLIGKLAPSRRRSATAPRDLPRDPAGWTRFRVAHRRGITVVAIQDASLVKENDLAELAGDLVALIEAGHQRMVVDFVHVERLSVRAVDVLSGAIRACLSARGGAIKLAGLRPEVAAILAMAGLSAEVEVCPDAVLAIAGPWPESPDLRPLPVSLLSALLRSDRCAAPDAGPSLLEENSAMPGVRLVARSEPFEGRAVAVDGPRLVIGRASGCGLRLGFATVSRHHAAIESRGGPVVLVDLGSTNGTGLNGRPLHNESAELSDGDQVRIGPITFSVAIEPAARRSVDDPDVGLVVEHALALPLVAPSPGDTAFATDAGPDLPDDFGAGLGLKFDVIEGVVVVTPRLSALDDEESVDGLREALGSLADRHGTRRIVVNLAHVGHVSGRAIGVLLAHHLKLDRDGGALRVCEASPRVAAVLEGVHLGMLMECHPTVDDAVLAAWPRIDDGRN
jgi:anti-anti-sigma factor